MLSYVISFASFYIFVWFARRLYNSPGFRRDSDGLSRLVSSCVAESDEYERDGAAESRTERGEGRGEARGEDEPESLLRAAARLACCVVGIQVSYLLWGLMQERIMTKPYETGELFRSSKFLVFANRFLALFAALAALSLTGETEYRRGAPLYKFSYSSVSNILSSVCQYEALKYVSFPTQARSRRGATPSAAARRPSRRVRPTWICDRPLAPGARRRRV